MQLNHYRSGAGPPLVLMHGIGHHWQGWLPVIDRLTPQREVIAPDLPGFGASPMPPPGTVPGIGALADLVSGFLDDLGLERPHVAGNSMGGWLALELAKRGRVASATALSPAGFHNSVEAVYQRATLWTMSRSARLLAPRAEKIVSRPRLRTLAFSQIVARPQVVPREEMGPAIRALAYAPWFDEMLTALAAERFGGGERISVPTTIAWGGRDRLLLPHQARRAARAVPRARMRTLHGCGHVPMSDDPEQVAQVLLEGSAS